MIINRITRLVRKDLRDDMKTHLIFQLHKLKVGKLVKLYQDGDLIKYTMRILYQQMSPKCTNCFHQLYYPAIFREGETVSNVNFDKMYEELDYNEEDLSKKINNKIIKEAFQIILDMDLPGRKKLSMYEIFIMSYVDGYSNQEISEMRNIGIQSITNYKTKVLKDIKIQLRKNGYTTDNN